MFQDRCSSRPPRREDHYPIIETVASRGMGCSSADKLDKGTDRKNYSFYLSEQELD